MMTIDECLALLGDKAYQKRKNLIQPILDAASDIHEGLAGLATLQDVRLPLWDDIALLKEIHSQAADGGPYVSLDVAVRHYIANPHLADRRIDEIGRSVWVGEPIRTAVLLVREGGVLYSVDGLHRKLAYLMVAYVQADREFAPLKCIYADVPEGTMQSKVLSLNVLGKPNSDNAG